MARRALKKPHKIAKDFPLFAAGAAAVLKTGLSFLTKPGVLASARHLLDPESGDKYSARDVHEVMGYAEWIVAYLSDHAIEAKRIGIDGLPGSGKSTLAKALAARLGMDWVCLDAELPDEPYRFDRDDAVYEHYRLLRTQDPDAFDVIVFLDLPVERIKEQILERGRGAITTEIMEYDLLARIGRLAFDLADGETLRVATSRLYLKVRPDEGYRVEQNLNAALSAKGITQTAGLCKEEKLFLLNEGEARKGRIAYAQSGRYAQELLRNVAVEVLACAKNPSNYEWGAGLFRK